ncbi:SigE family RNA polymerase sigma factor [Streptomyces xiamenensis]|uniref:SigE family RNA polymerase sigma factor n=1 Tax=Streptomyces TaxID=1883 RepID=UPI0004CAA033|nr:MULTISPECIES: SigE family RNA polymerase sigma factor [Streptomyces]MCU4747096.1 SigE family RNA polymerase sigma factor [Streptomyces sp. G-5]QQN77760.1 SigE family RNA polymerase sigma factor [Streptomyces sp. XC 2026]
MSALHSISNTAVIGTTRARTSVVPVRCDVTGNTSSGAANRLGGHRGTGHARPAHLSAVDAVGGKTGETGGNGGTVRGARREGVTEAEFTAYVRERRASLYATAYHLTGDRHEAEDLLQSALLSTYRAWERITDKAAVGGYLRRTMTNLHISAWRRRKLNEYPTEELPESPGEYDTMRGTELRTVLWQALARLPEQQRTMLVLRYYEGQTDPEIAETLNISVGTVKSSIWRTLRRLREDRSLNMGRDVEESFGELVA